MTIRETAQVIGLIVSSIPAVHFGELYYKNLEKDKVLALQTGKSNYDAPSYLSKDAKADLSWWINNVGSSFKNVVQPNPDMTLTTDPSTWRGGWGSLWGTENWWHLEFGGARVSHQLSGAKSNLVRSQFSV